MELKGFTLAVCFNRDAVAGFQREQAWKCISEALDPRDTEDAELYEFTRGSFYGCVLTNLKLGKSRRISAGFSRNLSVMAAVDWQMPFLLRNRLEQFAELTPVGRIGPNGEFIPAEGAEMDLSLCGQPHKRWISPWKKKRMLLVWPDGHDSAQRIAREILSSSERKQTEKDIVIFTAEKGFLPDVLLFQNDYRPLMIQTENGSETSSAVTPDGSVILGDVGNEELKNVADYCGKYGYPRILAETGARLDGDVGVEIEYLDPSDHIRNLFDVYGFDRFAKRCDRAVVIVPDRLPDDIAARIEGTGMKCMIYQTPRSEAERAAVMTALLDE